MKKVLTKRRKGNPQSGPAILGNIPEGWTIKTVPDSYSPELGEYELASDAFVDGIPTLQFDGDGNPVISEGAPVIDTIGATTLATTKNRALNLQSAISWKRDDLTSKSWTTLSALEKKIIMGVQLLTEDEDSLISEWEVAT